MHTVTAAACIASVHRTSCTGIGKHAWQAGQPTTSLQSKLHLPSTSPLLLLPLQLATPIILPIPDLSHGYRSHRKQHGIIVFATNKGEVMAVSSKGERLWTEYVPTYWLPEDENQVCACIYCLAIH